MLIAITLASILILTALAWLLRRWFAGWLCPLCAGVAGTWMALLGAHSLGYPVELHLPAILLGGSVVGLASQGDQWLPERGETFRLAWKTLFVAAGFASAWYVTVPDLTGLLVSLAALGAIALLPWAAKPARSQRGQRGASERVQQLKAQMKNCC